VERSVAAVVDQIINTRARLIELERKIKEAEELGTRLEALEDVAFFEELCEDLDVEADPAGVEECQEVMRVHWRRLLDRG
jgi:hypothetical protein